VGGTNGRETLIMSRLRFRISMSLDGYVAGPNQSVEHPLGVGGMRLHEWVFELAAFRSRLGMEGGISNQSSAIFESWWSGIGATIMGRNMFGGHPGAWDAAQPWNGWWGDNPPFHHPVFVLSHHPRPPLELRDGNVFHFVTDGIESALEQARAAAGGQDVSLGGGANAARQYLKAGLVDQMDISLVPVLLGAGERLFEGLGPELHGLHCGEVVTAPGVTHLRFRR
jgi:dihydrofolate reductase